MTTTLQVEDRAPPSYHVVIVDYQKGTSVAALLNALAEQSARPTSISVIDNSPSAANWNKVASAIPANVPTNYVHFPENIGYTKACNAGAKGESSHILFLNPDIEFLSPHTMRDLLSFAGENGVNAPLGIAQKNPDNSYEPVARKTPTVRAILARRLPLADRIFQKSRLAYMDAYDCTHRPEQSDAVEVDWLQSSFLLVPRTLWNRIGGFDERYFVFMADVEYGNRCRDIGQPMQLVTRYCVAADGLRSSRGGIASIYKSKSLRIHLRDAVTYFLSRII